MSKKKAKKGPKFYKCPNCTREDMVAPQDACVLEALATVLVDRGHDPQKVAKMLSKIDTDELWNDVGPIIDGLESLL